MWPAVNLACTGHFAPVRLSKEADADDSAAYENADRFLHLSTSSFSCHDFPRHLAYRNRFESAESSNVQQPIYLMLLYGSLWRLFGVDWKVTNYLVAANAAASVLLLYLCCARFGNAILAAIASLAFVVSPVFLQNALSPRDGLKFPFAIAVSALLVTWCTSPCQPRALLFRSLAIGLLIGIGYGFRSDLYFFLAPAAIMLAILSQPLFKHPAVSNWRKIGLQLLTRSIAIISLVFSFLIGGVLPLINDSYAHSNGGTEGYHVLAMGLFGITNPDLFFNRDLAEPIYLYRNAYNNDIAAGVRIIEFAARRHDAKVDFQNADYFSYAKRYYVEIAKQIPADIAAGGFGELVNVMTFPASLRHHTNIVNAFDRENPFSTAYSFFRQAWPDAPLGLLDRAYHAVAAIPLPLVLLVNVCCTCVLLVRLTRSYGTRACIAVILLLGAGLAVTSLKFEIRHMFYIFALLVVAWVATLEGIGALGVRAWRFAASGIRGKRHHANLPALDARAALSSAIKVAAILVVAATAVLAVLTAARTYQASKVRSWLVSWSGRQTEPVEYAFASSGPEKSLIRILSAMPDSRGGTQLSDTVPPDEEISHLSVLAIRLDGHACDGRVVNLTAIGDTNEPAWDTTMRLNEPFSVRMKGGVDYTVYVPAFSFRSVRMLAGRSTYFHGIELATTDRPCIKSVAVVTKYDRDDLLFDFIVPSNLGVVSEDDLFKRVYIPGMGYL
jgi:hypothetical protein